MALTPSLSYSERNDNKVLTITDTTNNWGVGGNPNPADVTVITLGVIITISDGTHVHYDAIDLHAIQAHATQGAMVWDIDSSMLKVSTIATIGTDEELPDGIWNITYTLNTTAGTPEDIFIDGQVRVAVYELLRALPTIYNCTECKSKTVLDAIYCYGCLNVARSDAYVAKTEELLALLYTLERLVTNGSNYTW
jgi:hypothetical protein